MEVTQNSAYVKWQNGRDDDIQNGFSGPIAENIFLSLNNYARAVSARRRFHDY